MTNVVLVVMDTARYDETFKSGVTPNISSIADEGTKFTNAFAAAPWTLPSHASIFSGQYPSKHGSHAGTKQFNPDAPSVVEAFQDASYETVGISNNTWISGEFGFDRGFDTFRKNWQYVQTDADLSKIAREYEGIERWKQLARYVFDGNPAVNAFNAVYALLQNKQGTDDGAKRTNEWVGEWLTDRDDSDPFFLFINYLEPHLEYRPPREYADEFLPKGVSFNDAMNVEQDAFRYIAGDLEMTERDFDILRALYCGELAYLDERIGELKRHLEAANEWNDTIFVIVGDHGENIGDHGLMDHQYCLYDTLIHVPLVIRGGEFSDYGEFEDLFQLTDIAPTLLDAVGISGTNITDRMQGDSAIPLSKGSSREFVFSEYIEPQPSMEAIKKRIPNASDDIHKYDRSLRAIRNKDWKYIRGSDGSQEVFQIDESSRSRPFSGDTDSVIDLMDGRLEEWLASFEMADVGEEIEMKDQTKRRLEDLGYLQ